jgi:hypothetical protein
VKVMAVICGSGDTVFLRREFTAVDKMYFYLTKQLRVTHEFAQLLIEERRVDLDATHWIQFVCYKPFNPRPFIPIPYSQALKRAASKKGIKKAAA